ncbi:MAG: right-handed parallel beta-helix repeat-containing protein [Anaerolineales bacterium]
MKHSVKNRSNTTNNPISSQTLKWMAILVLVISLVLSPNIPVTAETNTEEIQTLPYHSYLPITQRGGNSYYVSPQGDDSNPGTFSHPWRTIRKAADSVEPGYTVYIHGGIYHEKIAINHSGTQDMPIRFYAVQGENPIIDGENHLPGAGSGLISIFGNWVEITGIEVQNSNYIGIGLYGEHDTVSNAFVHHSQKTGVYINGDYGTVQDSRIWRNSIINEYGVSSIWSSGLASSRDSENGITEYSIMRRNVVWENWGQGINAYESDHVTIEDNISHDNFVNNIYISNATNILCQRNFVYMAPSSYMYGYGNNIGIMLNDEIDYPSSNITIINNISFGNNWNFAMFKGTNAFKNVLVVNNMFINAIKSGGVLLRGPHQNVIFKNNIIQQDGDLPLIILNLNPIVSYSNNLWSKTPPSEASGSGDVIGDPQFAHIGDPFSPEWFRLTSLSPAIDGAVSFPEVSVDYFGNRRLLLPDMGAIEYVLAP